MAARTSTQTSLKGQAALDAAKAGTGFEKAPSAQKSAKSKGASYEDGGTVETGELSRIAEDMFGRDSRKDTAKAAPPAPALVQPPLTKAGTHRKPRTRMAKGQHLKQHKNGRWAVHNKETGRIVRFIKDTATRKLDGTFASVEDIAASKRRGLSFEEVVERRIEAVGRSLFQSTGGLTPARKAALIAGYKRSREARGWPVPKL